MNRRSLLRLLMVAGIAVAFASGHKAARSSAGTRDRDGALRRDAAPGFEGGFKESLTRDVAGARSWQEVKERVVKRWEASPGVTVDFELREETLTVLEKVPAADLEAWMRELRSVEWTDYDKDVPLQLREMALMVLARRGGGPFIDSLVKNPTENGDDDVRDALEYWTKHDPAAALDWLDGEVPEEIKRRLDRYLEDAFEHLAGKDPAEFERRLAMEAAEVREELLESYASRTGSPEGRERLLARAAGGPHGEAMAIWEGLLRREGTEDPERAYAMLRELKLSQEDRAELDESLVFHLLYPNFSLPLQPTEVIDRSDVMRAWAERNPGELVSESILRSFGRWSESDPERAAAWVAELPAGPRHEAFGKVLIGQQIENHEAFADKVARISDADIRRAMQRRLKESWQEKDPAKAAEWESGLPEEERERLK